MRHFGLTRDATIGVAIPAATEVEGLIYATDFKVARGTKACGIVFAIADVGQRIGAKPFGGKSTWSTETIDAKDVVWSVVVGPLLVVDKTWRNGIETKIDKFVGADNHGMIATTKFVDNGLQDIVGRIEVVAIELDGIAPTMAIGYGQVPTATNAEVVRLWNDVYEVDVVGSYLVDDFGSAVGAMIVDNDDIEAKVGLLPKSRANGIGNGYVAIADGYYDRGFVVERIGRDVVEQEVAIESCTNLLQMRSEDYFELLLIGFVEWVDIVELLLVGRAIVGGTYDADGDCSVVERAIALCTEPKSVD